MRFQFKKGDKIRCFSDCSGNHYGTFSHYSDEGEKVWSDLGVYDRDKTFPVINCSVDTMTRYLESKGYEVKPPPEPKSGVVYICENKFSGLLVFHTPPKNPTNKVIAVLPWVEGDGISEGGYYPGCDES